ncbi:MAG: rhomboid family intramembrane serine protease [Dermatophilaceae bacterium]
MSEPAAYPSGVGAPPVCPRHPERVAYVRCQRCHRPVCPECQRPAAVGVQCVDCVQEAARAAPRTTTVLGGRPSAGGPMVTMALIGICVALWLAQQASPRVLQELAFAPSIGEHEPWRFLTSAFLHGPLVHILFNMVALWMLGPYAEALLGRARYLALYLLSALGGTVAYLLLTPLTSNAALVGASGAVFGLFGAIIVLNRSRGLATQGIWVNLAINAVLPVFYPTIAWQAHIGGFLTGMLLAFVFARARRSAVLAWGPAAAVALALVGVAAARYGAF